MSVTSTVRNLPNIVLCGTFVRHLPPFPLFPQVFVIPEEYYNGISIWFQHGQSVSTAVHQG